ncbi:hypothetical protein [Marinobacter xestospongiae]|uniref:Uncharacterized protein n=1 Tax=Marinobacter xestospongiae TaxID=994319 RepID=A0ABU3W1I2_9GAMM|nr:hypothetical protein [Marinobacter xestospongiae]MDV2080397.1 hypothetical protein [Marinobacter xestospongiae]
MKNIHKPIADFMAFYATKLNDDAVLSVLNKLSIDTEDEAKSVVAFLDAMCKQVLEDSKTKIVVLSQTVCTSDAEKVCAVVEDCIEAAGYRHLVVRSELLIYPSS